MTTSVAFPMANSVNPVRSAVVMNAILPKHAIAMVWGLDLLHR